MRGTSEQQIESLIALTPEDLVPAGHPIRRIKPLADRALQQLSPTFARMYAKVGRPSVPPEHLLKASLLIALYSVRSERQFCDRLGYDMLFRWFLDLNVRGGSFDQSTFAKNRARLLEHEVTGEFFRAVVEEARRQHLLSEDHFSVDGTLLEAWTSIKSVRPKDEDPPPPAEGGGRNPWKDFKGEKRSNATHASTTDPEALLARKGNGQPAKLSFAGHVLMENRNGLVVDPSALLRAGSGALAGHGDSGDRRGGDDAGASAHHPAHHGRGGQGLRHQGVRGHLPFSGYHAPRREQATLLGGGRPDDPARGV